MKLTDHWITNADGTMTKEHIGPEYPELGATVAKFRRKAASAGSIKAMERADRVAYADAIEKAIRAKHRTLHMKPSPPTTPGWYNPPSITRLLRYENPIPMAGDPIWDSGHDLNGNRWQQREQVVYAFMMQQKHGGPLIRRDLAT